MEKDHYFPADLLLVSSTNDDSIAYVETMNLDGETNLKIKKALDQTKGITEQNVKDLKVRALSLAHAHAWVPNIALRVSHPHGMQTTEVEEASLQSDVHRERFTVSSQTPRCTPSRATSFCRGDMPAPAPLRCPQPPFC